MKKRTFLPFLPLFILFFTACEKQEPAGEYYEVAVPITQPISEFRASVKIQEPRVITEAGKIYSYKDYVFVNDKYQGVHVIDNRDPYAPKKIRYINIPRNLDIAVKNDMLYADSGMDLVVFDISSIENIKQVERVKDVFSNNNFNIPSEAMFVDDMDFDPAQEVILGYSIEKRRIEMTDEPYFLDSAELANGNGNSTGTGGSLARFKIVSDYLYVVDRQNISVFDIAALSQPQKVFEDYVGWDVETIFNQDDHLFLGSTTGMYIYSIENPETPSFVSMIRHVLGCDPVVVKDDIAYVTVRGGNLCGQQQSELMVIDVADKSNPQTLKTYVMENPYGLGVREDQLFICDGDAGLKIYNTINTPDLTMTDHFEDINTYDIIPLEETLLMIGDNILRQYNYKNNEINLISTFNLN
ncbi:hypothetical protein RM549_16705 [Salegentibacter sp. F188]|uniref:LVIVD repeat-containing protein n=1 Tax=Autumnicola patrickiae TaxID=3075591 RepID=A0ABU3E726_9FLAO|nr:hypothetical protein [Salegentibacter sp. F188]MDT0691439.1 hypothetical protein [Salegentibacter sp. F188]